MYFTFIVFVLLLVLINSYFLISLRIDRKKKKKVEKRKEEIREYFIEIFERQDIDREEKIRRLEKVFDTKIDIQAFALAAQECYKKGKYRDNINQLLEEVVDIRKIIDSGIVRREYRESYALYLISEFNISNKEAGDFALKSLNKNSIYRRNYALNVIKKNRDISYMMKALDMIDSKKYYFNEKIVIDFLDNYGGDKEELDDKLYEKFDSYNVDLRKDIIVHFNNMRKDSKMIRDKMLDIIENSKERELVISATRYFSSIKDERVRRLMIKNIRHKDWSIRAINARVIAKYANEEVREKLKEGLRDSNYYVRYNSASSYLQIEDSQLVIEEALKNEDRFARDILLYTLNKENIISLEEYEKLEREVKDLEGAVGL